jgi:serine/threonine protein kinase
MTEAAQLPSQTTPQLLNQRYELREVLGEGGMGRVYRGFDRVLGRIVAVKVLMDAQSASMIQRFEREAQTLSQLNHPNLAAVHDFGVCGTQPFIVMEFIEGKNLARLLQEKPLSASQAMALIAQIGEGLAAAHDRDVIHRDMKPENVLISQRHGKDWVEIVDFGVAASLAMPTSRERLTVSGFVVGTQRYMAPEQMEGKPATPATDIFSFGLLCAEMLCGAESVMAGRLRATDAFKERAGRYWPVLERACQEEPDKRWPSVRAMMEAFRAASPSSVMIPQRPPSGIRRQEVIRQARRQHQFGWAMTIFGILLIVAAGFLFLQQENFPGFGSMPIVLIKKMNLVWENPEKLVVHVDGEVRRAQPQRMFLEVVLCDKTGNRIYSAQSTLVDRSLGSVQVLDVVKAPQTFEKDFIFRLPKPIAEGYAAVTFFDHANLLVAHQNSALWKSQNTGAPPPPAPPTQP